MPRRFTLCALAIVLCLLSSTLVLAQTVTGTMQGTVTDSTGAALPGVTVTVRNLDTGLERVVTTNEAGFFNSPFLPVGRYRVRAELAGLGSAARTNVGVELNQTTVSDFVLTPSLSETVTVTADAPRINVTDGEIKQTMRSEEIMNRPNASQTNFLALAETFAGFQDNPSSGQNNPMNSSGSSVNFNGAGTRGTTFQIDGVNNDDASENQNRQGVALATIKSFQVLTNSYSAEFGRGHGAVVLVQTKSGTNTLAGELYGYAQDSLWNEKNFFLRDFPKAENYRRQYGITGGFPIIRDRLFAFGHYDSVDRAGTQDYSRSIFTAADLALPRLTLNNDTPANRAFIERVVNMFPKATPNDARGPRVYSTAQPFDQPDEDYSLRLDWNVTNSFNLTARGQRSHQIRTAEDIILGENIGQDNRQANYGATFTHVLTANTFHEGRYGLGLRDTNGDVLAGNDTPIIRFGGILPFGPIIGSSTNWPMNRDQRDQQFVYNISTSRWAKHTLRAGTDIRRSSLDDRAENANRGFYTFNATCGGVTYPTSIHAFFAGCVSTFTKGYGPAYVQNNLNEMNFYAQDDWRPFDNLTLNLGVRYERVDEPKEEKGRIEYGFEDTQYVDPRFGFAYTPNWDGNRFVRALTGGNGRFSIRGGYGHSHGRVFQSIFSQSGVSIRFNTPNAASLSFLNATNVADPTNGFVFTPGNASVRVTRTEAEPDLQMPETRQWNLTFERQMFAQSRLRVSYLGTMGHNLLRYRFGNLPVKPGTQITVADHPFNNPAVSSLPNLRGKTLTFQVAKDWRCAGTGLPGIPTNATCPTAVPIAENEISLRVPRTNERRPNPLYGNVFTVENGGKSWYHAGQLEFETGLVRGFQGRATYTFGKALDLGSEATSTGVGDINFFPPENERYAKGLSRFDTRHRFTFNGSYALPFWRDRKDLLGSIFGGWHIASTIRLSSGTPYTIVDSGALDINFDGFVDARPIAVDDEFSGGWHVNYPGTSREKMARDKFRRATPDDSIDDLMGRNTYFTDGLEQVDLSLSKRFSLPMTGQSLVLRLDAFNVFDHVTWGYPSNDFAAATFGQILTTHVNYQARSFQIGVRYLY